ncbi:YdcF family protein [Malikia spinosa]|uniref:YdcF family protein n=1 Tax=Malikia spinosa TaxID=86180 RepID=UPI0027BA512E|nr:YdcF family protein [Malikia spinosa]
MEIYLHKLLPLLALPTGLVLLLLVVALLLRQRWPVWLALSLFSLGSTPWISDHLVRWSEAKAVRQDASSMGKAQAIVVLSEGRVLAPGPAAQSEWNDGDRFWGGIELYRADKAPWLVFTGGWAPWQPELAPEGEVLKTWARSQGIPSSAIQITGVAMNTAEEAAAVAALLPKLSSAVGTKQKTILLVTSAFHMPRAQRLFEQAGLAVLPYPVDFKVSARGSFSAMDLLPSASAWQRTEMAWRELLGRAWYATRAELAQSRRYLTKYLP